MLPDVVNVSPHVLMDVLTCETKAWTRHVRGYTSRQDGIKLTAGSAVHAGIAEFLKPLPSDADAFRDVTSFAVAAFHRAYDARFAELPADQLPDPAYTPANLERLLARWCEMHPPTLVPWTKVLMVEEAFEARRWQIGETIVRLIVRPDAVVEDQFGLVRWLDTKTTGWRIADVGWRKALRLSLQAQLYTDAVVQRFGPRAAAGGWFNAMELRQLPGGGEVSAAPKMKKDGTPAAVRKCPDHGKPYAECGIEHAKSDFVECMTTREKIDGALLDAKRGVVGLLGMMAATNAGVDMPVLDQRGAANGSCRFCPAADWCDAGRIASTLENFMVHDPWIVEEGHRE